MSAPVILVVDDDPELRETLVDVLEDSGYGAIAAEHGKAALELLQRTPELPAAILLDLMMPVMDGAAFARALHQDPRLAGIPIAIFTAHSDHQRVAEELGAAAGLSKPLKLEDLLSALERVVHPHLVNERRPAPEAGGG